jgi:hypothetical protein
MSNDSRERPCKTLRKQQSKMAGGTHMAHHNQPARSLMQQRTHGMIVWDGFDHVRQKDHLVSLVGNESPYQKIVGRLIFDRFVAAERGQA